MIWISMIALILSGVGIYISIKAYIQSQNATKAVLKQNLEKEQAEIEKELADIDVEIEREKSAGHEISSHIFGVPTTNPRICEIVALENKRDVLLSRKEKIDKQLQQL